MGRTVSPLQGLGRCPHTYPPRPGRGGLRSFVPDGTHQFVRAQVLAELTAQQDQRLHLDVSDPTARRNNAKPQQNRNQSRGAR
jgi:hypothetical protein